MANIPAGIVTLFQDCCIPLQRLAGNPLDAPAWKFLFLLPRMILQPTTRRGTAKDKIRAVCLKFLSYWWEELLQGNIMLSHCQHQMKHIKSKQLYVWFILGSSPEWQGYYTAMDWLQPSTMETVNKLMSKHPPRSEILTFSKPSPDNTFIVSQDNLSQATRSSPCGSGSGPSGWKYEHLKLYYSVMNILNLIYMLSVLLWLKATFPLKPLFYFWHLN